MHEWYTEWQTLLGGACEKSNEDARFVLPNAAETKMVVTMNARSLMKQTSRYAFDTERKTRVFERRSMTERSQSLYKFVYIAFVQP